MQSKLSLKFREFLNLNSKAKRKRFQVMFISILVLIILLSFTFSIYNQSKEYQVKYNEIIRLKKEIKNAKDENKLLKNSNYIKNEFRKKYNYVEGNEKIVTFPQDSK